MFLMKSCSLSPIISLFSIFFSIISRTNCYVIILSTEMRLIVLLSFLQFLKMRAMFSLSQSLATSPDYYNFLNIMDCDLTTSSTSSIRTHGCILSGPMDLCTSRFLRWSQSYPSPVVCGSPFSLSLLLASATSVVWIEKL